MRVLVPSFFAVFMAACSGASVPDNDAAPIPEPDAAAGGGQAMLVLNEIVAAGDPDDWFEVVNLGDVPIQLGDYVYSDVDNDLAAAVGFEPRWLLPGDYAVQVVSDAVSGFKLASDEALWIFTAADGTLVDGVDWDEGDAPVGFAYARIPDGTGAFTTVDDVTQGEAND